MKKIGIVLLLAIAIGNGYSQSIANGAFRNRMIHKSFLKTTPQNGNAKVNGAKSMILFEDFQSGVMPSDYTIINEDGSALPPSDMPLLVNAWIVSTDDGITSTNSMAFSSSWQAAGNASDWMILPQKAITTGTYLKWKSMVYFGGGTSQRYEVRIATSIAGTVPAPTDFVNTPVDTVTETNYTWQQHSIDIGALGYNNCNIWVAFRNVSPGTTDPMSTDILFLDDITIAKPVDIDASLEALNTPFINGTTLPIGGRIRNLGVQNITSFDVVYNINGAANSSVEHVAGIDLAMNDTLGFVHSVPYTFSTTGNYIVNVKIFNVNSTADADTTNNALAKNIIIGEDNSLKKMPLCEYFGSNNWPLGEGGFYDVYATAMNNFNTNYFNNASNYSKATFISYQQSPDPYSIPECLNRYGFYQVTSYPAVFTDAVVDQEFDDLSSLDVLQNQPAFFELNSTQTMVGDSIFVNVSILPYATVDAKLQVAVVEKTTTGNLGDAEVTAYKNVLMKMLPDDRGTTVNLTKGTPLTLNFKYDMSATHAEQMNDLSAIVFLQDSASKYVYQSASSEFHTGMGVADSKEEVVVYPNPSNGWITIGNADKGVVSVYNQVGALVAFAEIGLSNQSIDLSGQPSGCYMLKIGTKDKTILKKIFIVKWY